MRYPFFACLLILLLLPACVLLQRPLWRPEALRPIETTHEHASSMIAACNSNGYKGQTFASLEESKNAQCQPSDSGQECALLAVYPESRVFSYVDARRYTATVQAKTLFNMTVDGAGNIRQCRTETE